MSRAGDIRINYLLRKWRKLKDGTLMTLCANIDWTYLSCGTKDLKINFVDKFESLINWEALSLNKDLCVSIVYKYHNRLNLHNVLVNNKYGTEFFENNLHLFSNHLDILINTQTHLSSELIDKIRTCLDLLD